jgi:transposase
VRTLVETSNFWLVNSPRVKRSTAKRKGPPPIPEPIRRRAAALYRRGNTLAQIAASLGISERSVWTFAKDAGATRPTQWTAERKRKAVKLYLSGMTLEQVARRMKSVENYVSRMIQSEGVKVLRNRPHAKARWNPRLDHQVARRYKAGWSTSRLVKHFKTSFSRIYDSLRRSGFTFSQHQYRRQAMR